MAIAGRSYQQWKVDNKLIIAIKMKQYNQDNKEIIAELKKEYYNDNKLIIAIKKKQYHQDNKEIIAEKAKKTYICDCGKTSTIYNKLKHEKTTNHQSFITNQYYINELTYYIL